MALFLSGLLYYFPGWKKREYSSTVQPQIPYEGLMELKVGHRGNMRSDPPLFLKSRSLGKLKEKIQTAHDLLRSCTLCPRRCRVNRLQGERGHCRQGAAAKICRALPHFGEEPPLSGVRGAGTVFFTGCALHCRYCQNYQISQEDFGEEKNPEALAEIFLNLQNQGCHNLDWVSPTPHLPFILSALDIAADRGLRLPIVYNTHGYLSETALSLLEGVVDIYLPDMKYASAERGDRFSDVPDYPRYNRAAIREMFRQVGPLQTDEDGIGIRGLLVRHLVLPGDRSEALAVLNDLASLSTEIPVSLMAQYRPCYRSGEIPELNRPLDPSDYEAVVEAAQDLGFEEIYIQSPDSAEVYYPDFREEDPFLSARKVRADNGLTPPLKGVK